MTSGNLLVRNILKVSSDCFPCFFCLAFSSICFALKNVHLSFRSTMFLVLDWSSSWWRDWSKIAIGLLQCCRTPRVLQISPATATNDSDFGKALQSGHWCFAEFSQSPKISVWFMSASNCCDSSLNCWSPAFDSCLWGIVPYADVSRTSQSALRRYFIAVHPAVSPLRSIYQVFCSQLCCFGFFCSSPHLVAIPKMILLLVPVDLVNHFAN